MNNTRRIVVVPGDGIGPAITESVKTIILATGLKVEFEDHQMGKDASREQIDKALNAFARHGIMLKGPTETPVATKGQKSFNVTSRKGNGLFINFRRSQSFHPLVQTHFPKQDIVIFRENEEGLYAAIEHQHSPDVVQALSYKTFSGMHKIIRAAFEYAVDHQKTKVCCMHKGNILKKTEGSFLEIFKKVALDYPQINATSQIIDDGMAKVATNPEFYEVIVTENLFGDILSDITTALTGSLGLGGSSNIGYRGAMFEAIHGTGPDIVPGAKFNNSSEHIANPSGLLQAGILMLEYINTSQSKDCAGLIKKAWMNILEQGFHTGDLSKLKNNLPNPATKRIVNTKEFTQLICDQIEHLKASGFNASPSASASVKLDTTALLQKCQRTRPYLTPHTEQRTEGLDVFVNWTGKEDPNIYAELEKIYGYSIHQDFNLQAFSTLHQWFDWVVWLRKSLSVLPAAPLSSLINDLNLADFLTSEALNRSSDQAIERWTNIETQHLDLVKIITLSLVQKLRSSVKNLPIKLEMISNRGQCVYPTIINPDLVDQFRCRFLLTNPWHQEHQPPTFIPQLMTQLIESGIYPVKTEGLHEFKLTTDNNWQKGYGSSYGQGMGSLLEKSENT
ncbi:MAG: hypothetical protein K2Q26_11375 [Bdellovibrionales bacterium]|nr:hypothetical protein [Bdellovibrionales bacterium]